MNLLKPLIAGAIGTTFMTMYSYGYSRLRKKQFREPVLLAELLSGSSAPERKKDFLKGWMAHYLVGAAFSISYQQFLKGKFNQHPALKSIITGGAYGFFVGVPSWKAAFTLHPQPPKIAYREFYLHLVLAHLVFGYFAFGKIEEGKK